MKLSTTIYLFLTLLVIGCNNLQKPKQTLEQKQKELDKGEINEKNVYTVKELGWAVMLPEKWEVMSKRESDKMNNDGQKVIEELYGTRVDDSKLIALVNIRKNLYNSFLSTMEPFDETKDGDHDQKSIASQEMIMRVYRAQDIPFDQALGAVRIDGIMFDRLELKVYAHGKKKIILEQKLFTALINGYSFAMAINYNNPDDRKTLMSMVMGSKFSKKE